MNATSDAGIRFIRHAGEPVVFKAGWVIKDPETILENAGLAVAGGKILEVLKHVPEDRPVVVDCGPGILMPPLVNAHLHLELSALKNRLPLGKGFAPWVAALLRERDSAGTQVLVRAARAAIRSLPDLGVGLAGEVSTLGITRSLLSNEGIAGVWFREYLGDGHDIPDLDPRSFLSVSAAGHAPHTTSPDRLISLKHQTCAAGLPFSIHVAESDLETDFIAGIDSGWNDFLAARGIDASFWPVGGKTPVAYLNALGVLGPDTLGVHLLQVTEKDLDILADTKTFLCLCPRSNQNLHGRLPDIRMMLKKKLTPALGTDSLASCESLSIFDEMAFIRRHYPGIAPADILAMATKNGASALGLGLHYGTLDPGRQSNFIYLDTGTVSRADILEKVTSYGTG
ncbi:MAG: amidohydrolase family protein [Desulfotignum sp.]|nr:amidohydrolase family protein [Desulfotignum sp.]